MNTQMIPAPKAALLSLAAAGALALTACGPDDALDTEGSGEPDSPVTVGTEDSADENGTAEEAEGQQDSEESPAAEDGDAGRSGEPLHQAVEAALAEYPDGVITELDTDDSYYEIFVYDGQTEWELEVDRESFEIIDTEDDGIDSDDQEKAEAVEIDIIEALTTAAEEGGAEVEQAELDTEDGTVVWEIELTNDVEVYVDVTNGEVVKVDS
mgnify:CR=1 FL=1